MNWSSMYLTFYFGTFFRANSQPVFLCLAGKTYPKAPEPKHFPSSKSSKDIPVGLIFLLDAVLERPKLLLDVNELVNVFTVYFYSEEDELLKEEKVLLKDLLLS